MNFLGMIRNRLLIIYDNVMARPKKVVVEEAPAPKKVKKEAPVTDRPLTKKERMAQQQGFAK